MTRVHKLKGIRQRDIGYRDIYGTAATYGTGADRGHEVSEAYMAHAVG